MAIYPLIASPTFSYEDHLMYNQYVVDINKGLSKATTNIVRANAYSAQKATTEIVRANAYSAQIVRETMDRNASFLADSITHDISTLSETFEFSIDKVAEGINGLRADFDIAMGKVITQFEMMRSEMQASFSHIINILENKRKIEAEEHFKDALEFYNEGCRFTGKPQWFGDALKHFLSSVDKFERNPIAHLHIGHIYHYQEEYRDFDKALEHYQLAFTYGEADEKDYPIAAKGYFYAGWLYAAVFDNYDEAILLTMKAFELDGSLGEAHYHLAKFYGVRGKSAPCCDHLRKAIVDFDRNYWRKVSADPDFERVWTSVYELFVCLEEEAKKNLKNRLGCIDHTFDPRDADFRKRIRDLLAEVDDLLSSGTYFALTDGIEKVAELDKLLADAKEAYEINYKHSTIEVQKWDSFLATHISLAPRIEQEAVANLNKAKLLLQEDSHLHQREAGIALASLWGKLCNYESTVRAGTPAHKYGVSCVAFSPDSRFLVTGGHDGIIKLWDARLKVSINNFLGTKSESSNIMCIAYSQDGNYIITGNGDRTICLWDPSSGRVIKRSDDFQHHIHCIAFNPCDSRFVAISSITSDSLKLFDVHKWHIVDGFFKGKHDYGSDCVAFSPCGMYIASGGRTITLWNFESGKPFHEFDIKGHSSIIIRISFSPDGKRIVSGSIDHTLRLWDMQSGRVVSEFDGTGHSDIVNSVAFSPDGRFIVSCSEDSTVRLWDAQSGSEVGDFDGTGHSDIVNSVAFSPDGQLIVSGSNDTTLRFWKYNWMTKESHNRLIEEKRLEKKKAEEDRRRSAGLCLTCNEPIGFFQKLKGMKYCKKHQLH